MTLSNLLLTRCLAKHGYRTAKHTHGLWTHDTRPIKISLVVDDFGVMYVKYEHAERLNAALEGHNEISTDWTSILYYGITMKWDFIKRTVDLYMPGYGNAVLYCFQHPDPVRPQHSSHKHHTINYGAKVQFIAPEDFTKPLTAEHKITLQQVVGCLLQYTHAISYNDCLSQHSCFHPDEWHIGNIGDHGPVIELMCHTSGCRNMIPCIRYDYAHHQRCILPRQG
jgi:hypothetical protein